MIKTNQSTSTGWVNLATFDRLDRATALQAFLEKEGCETQIHDERNLQKFWFLSPQQAGIHLRVRADSYTKAKQSLETKPEFLLEAITCPSCHSSRVQYPAMTRKNILPTVVAQTLVLLRVMERECYCEDCHHSWVRNRQASLPGRWRTRLRALVFQQ